LRERGITAIISATPMNTAQRTCIKINTMHATISTGATRKFEMKSIKR
jgi:hypothetical protein